VECRGLLTSIMIPIGIEMLMNKNVSKNVVVHLVVGHACLLFSIATNAFSCLICLLLP